LVAYADPVRQLTPATFAMTDDNLLPFSSPAVARKKVTIAFDRGGIRSVGSITLLAVSTRLPCASLNWQPPGNVQSKQQV
jgi:hypothetical protein